MTDHTNAHPLSRRHLLMGLGLGGVATLAGCTSGPRMNLVGGPVISYRDGRVGTPVLASANPEYAMMYGPIEDGGFLVPAIDLRRVDAAFLRREVADPTGAPPGTVVIDTAARYAYFTQGNGTAMRYGVGIGREGFAWAGDAVVQWKRKWPTWTPPAEMVARQPELTQYANGMDPGLKNPLGARALYLFHDGQDTLFRLHGTPEYWTIGKAVSSGCVRFMNHDIIDLYDRVPNGSTVIVLQGGMV